MAYVIAAALILVVVGAAWLSSRRGQAASGCCAPADPRKDLRMRAAYDAGDEPGDGVRPSE